MPYHFTMALNMCWNYDVPKTANSRSFWYKYPIVEVRSRKKRGLKHPKHFRKVCDFTIEHPNRLMMAPFSGDWFYPQHPTPQKFTP